MTSLPDPTWPEPVRYPTEIPCPDWCTRPGGHPFTFDLYGSCYHRAHCGDLDPDGTLRGLGLLLNIEQMELAVSPAGPVEHEPIGVHLTANDSRPYSATVDSDRLRHVAEALRRAATHLDALGETS